MLSIPDPMRPSSCVLHDANLRRPQHPTVQLEALLLCVEARAILLVRLRRLEDRLMHIGVEFLGFVTWVEALEAVLLQRADED